MSDPDPLLDSTNDPTPDDPDAVQNLITSLRASLTSTQTLLSSQVARLARLVDVEAELETLRDEKAFIAAAKEAVEVQLKEEIKKREVAEETVEAMRGQVESARRGVMTLQKQEKERKRMSTMGLTGLGGLGLGQNEEEEVLKDLATGNNKEKDKAKRQSTLKSHRRISSQSEPDGMYASSSILVSPNQIATPVLGGQVALPTRGGLREFKLGSSLASNSMTSPPPISTTSPLPTIAQEDTPVSPIIDPSFVSSTTSNPNAQANEEAARLRNEVYTLQTRLEEAEEAREASEVCLKALREFIATSPGGGGTDNFDGQMNLTSADLVGIRLPPLPTDKDPDEPPTPPAKEEKRATTGWGIGKLWKGQGPAAPASVMSPHSTAVEPSTPGLLSPGPSIRSLPQRSTSPTSVISQLPSAQEPIEDKLNAIPTSSMPLASFVASWTKTVAPGTPAATPLSASTSGSDTRPSAARAFSGLWGRKKDDKEKELPSAPASGGEVPVPMSAESSMGLEPSPLIADSEPVFDFSAKQEGQKDEEEVEAEATTPTQAERGSRDLHDLALDDGQAGEQPGAKVEGGADDKKEKA